MNFVTFLSQSFSKLGCNNAATAKSWVAHDSNVHKQILVSKSMTNIQDANARELL
jgi:acyl-[acyl carrier protein]--UDP-N-acetylglucosamine O-acyltransferase